MIGQLAPSGQLVGWGSVAPGTFAVNGNTEIPLTNFPSGAPGSLWGVTGPDVNGNYTPVAMPKPMLPPPPQTIAWDNQVTPASMPIATGLSVVTGHWLATWLNGHAGGPISPALGRGTSLTLTGTLALAMDVQGNLTIRGGSGQRVSLNLYGR